MPTVRKSLVALASATACFAFLGGVAHADTTITFDDLTFTDYDAVPTGYQSFAASTPDVGVDYSTVSTAYDPVSSQMDLWHTSYSDLVNVAFPSANGNLGKITFTPTGGHTVTLNSFDIGGWPTSVYSGQTIQLIDIDNIVLLDYSPATVGGAVHNTFTPNFTSADPLSIVFGPNYNIGIDNISISEDSVTATPEPGSFVVFGVMLATGAAFSLRRRRIA